MNTLSLLLLAACGGSDVAVIKHTVDADSDGYAQEIDCDDSHATIHPDAPELCDGVDNNCDGLIDGDDATDGAAWYADQDGDGFGDPLNSVTACAAPSGYLGDDTDCDDGDAAFHPGAPEPDCTDPADYNCDGSVGYADADADGFPACADCDDQDATRSPAAAEVCDEADLDEDCDGWADDADDSVTGLLTWTRDVDADGWGADGGLTLEACAAPTGYAGPTGDCDDYDGGVNPGATERCDAADRDEDCDGSADDADSSTDPSSWQPWYRDDDSDGYGDAARSIAQCEAAPGTVADATDCDDGDGAIHPGAVEVCDAANTDEDCDGLSDDADTASGGTIWYADQDSDGYGDPAAYTSACDAPSGAVADATDCDDGDGSIHPGAAELCDALDVDEDCDNLADDLDSSVSGGSSWLRDLDGDGYAPTGAATTVACSAPAGYTGSGGDCDDSNAGISPAAAEVCDALDVDEDCDNLSDDADASVSAASFSTFYADSDGDGFGDPAAASARCDAAAAEVDNADDCDDASAAIHPNAAEQCDTADVDEDCDGLADDDDSPVSGTSAWYADDDGDGYGGAAFDACDPPSGSLTTSTDCDDSDASVSPGAAEVCDDGVDQDCSGGDDACPEVPYAGVYDASDEDVITIYGAAGDKLGAGLVGGDFNGDGVGDLIIGAWDATHLSSYPNYGVVYGYYGPLTQGDQAPSDNDDFLFYSASSSDTLWGSDLFNIGDVNGDGADDWGGSATSVYTYEFYGGDAGTGVFNLYDENGFGCSHGMSAAGRFTSTATANEWTCNDADYGSSTGRIYVLGSNSSSAHAYYTGESAYDYAGWSVAGGGDANGDGLDELWIGAPCDDDSGSCSGSIYLELGGGYGGLLSSADAKLTGGAAGDQLGSWSGFVGDATGDGYDDLLVSAPYQDTGGTDAGTIYLITTVPTGTRGVSSVATTRFYGDTANDKLGIERVDSGDLNGDGDVDLAFSGYMNGDGGAYAGSVYLMYGPVSGTYDMASAADVQITGDDPNDYLGIGEGVAVIPDMDGDGDDELAFSSYLDDDAGTDAGAVWVWLGR